MDLPFDIHVVDVGPDLVPRAPSRRFVPLSRRVWSVAWSRDGSSVLYSVVPLAFSKSRLWRADVEGARRPERLELAPEGAVSVGVSPAHDRLAFTLERSAFANVFRFEPGRAPKIVLASPGGDSSPRFSPDGGRVLFESHGEDGYADVWTIEAAGGRPQRLTESRFHAGRASWSRDGRFVYYREDRADGRDIVRIPADGGTPRRVTRKGGHFARPSADGRWLFYSKTDPTSPLFRLALPDGPEQRVVDCVQSVSLGAGPDGMYYAGCVAPGSGAEILRLDAASGRRHLLGRLPPERSLVTGLAVSPEGKTILFSSQQPRYADLMLIEDFRWGMASGLRAQAVLDIDHGL